MNYDFVTIIATACPALIFLAKIAHNTGKLAQAIESMDRRLALVEQKVFLTQKS